MRDVVEMVIEAGAIQDHQLDPFFLFWEKQGKFLNNMYK